VRRDRFLGEQRTLARLNHQAIAHIYDAGMLKDGTPWFVMEFADGQPITEYLRHRQTPVSDALLLFRAVCEAVQYAHGLAIIHRDLKPSNIFVTTAGEVKLLDFGIAKNLDPQEAESQATIAGMRLMSPAYAAPEQRSGGTLGVFTDIYALGVLLYEILTGDLPVTKGGDAGRISLKLSQAARQSPSCLVNALDRHQAEDLDVICLTAMQPDPNLRYKSADALARDIQAYLEGRPLEGRRNAILYTTSKFVRRNRLVLLSVASVVLIFTATAIAFAWRLNAAREAALAETARVNRVLDFTQDLFDGGDPAAGPNVNLKATDILDRGKQEALHLSGDPRLRTRLLTALGTSYGKLGQIPTADQLLQEASSELRSQAGVGDDDLKPLAALAELRQQERRLPEAEQILRRAIAAATLQHCSKDLLERLHADLGAVLALRGQYKAAETELQNAIDLRSPGTAPNQQYAEDLTQLAEVDHYLGRYDAAAALNEQALQINLSLRGQNHPAIAENLNNLAAIAQSRADYGKAEGLLRQALAITQSWYGADHPATADALTALSTVMIAGSKLNEANATLERALAIQIHAYGERHASVAITYNQLGLLASARNDDDTAERDYRSALGIWQKLYGPDHQFVGLAYSNLASVYAHRKNYLAAEQMSRKAVAIYATALSGENMNSAVAHLRLGRILLREGKLSDAEKESLAGYRYFVANSSPSDAYLIAARKDLGQIETGLGRPELSFH
jgi:serine/threonine-protein kinase